MLSSVRALARVGECSHALKERSLKMRAGACVGETGTLQERNYLTTRSHESDDTQADLQRRPYLDMQNMRAHEPAHSFALVPDFI